MLQFANSINWNDNKYIRGGIIPYNIINNTCYYAFGIANIVGDLCDFGGHREITDNDLLDTIIREYQEECFNIFGELDRQMLLNLCVLETDETVEILLPVTGSLYEYTYKFRNIINNNEKLELQNIVWITYKQLNLCSACINNVDIVFIYDKISNCFNLPHKKKNLNQSTKHAINIRTNYLLYLTCYNEILSKNNLIQYNELIKLCPFICLDINPKMALEQLIIMGFFNILY